MAEEPVARSAAVVTVEHPAVGTIPRHRRVTVFR